MVDRPLSILVVDDSEDETELILRELGRSGLDISSRRVASADELRDAIAGGKWDIVICDQVMPGFDALAALEILRESQKDLPLVVVSGRVGEEFAVEVMRAGAQDFVLKDRLSRLAVVIEREVAEAAQRRARRAAENALAESEQRTSDAYEILHDAMESSPSALAIFDADDRLIVWNSKYAEYLHRDPDRKMKGLTFEEIVRRNIESGQIDFGEHTGEEWFADRIRRHRERKAPFEVHLHDGRVIQVTELATTRGGVAMSYADVTQLVEREEQLRQAQKMEAVGQITGGVAHDFNNLLSVIVGNLELLEDDLRGNIGLLDKVGRAQSAAERASGLVQRLLSFSRRQDLKPQPEDLGALVEGMKDLIRRTLSAAIEIEVRRAPDLWACEVDPLQLENALLNLAINARDAMPDGGRLTIETDNATLDSGDTFNDGELRTGNYVGLSVIDTGTGMTSDVAARSFDPFFTTKDVGKGSGLGLSMVYGFVKQSGGHVAVDSVVGRGTKVSLYLPRAKLGEPDRAQAPVGGATPAGHGETVLVVEDDPDVRDLVVGMLGTLGYRAVDVGTGPAALALLANRPQIDLVLSDQVLPGGIKGLELMREVNSRWPSIKILLMSGYADSAVNRLGSLARGIEPLRKPFHRTELARKVRQALDSSVA